jgi:5'-nucleotidase
MADTIDRKLVIAVSSSALFDLNDSDRVFREKGAAFPFVRRFLSIN